MIYGLNPQKPTFPHFNIINKYIRGNSFAEGNCSINLLKKYQRKTNKLIEIVATTDVDNCIFRFGFAQGKNEFLNVPAHVMFTEGVMAFLYWTSTKRHKKLLILQRSCRKIDENSTPTLDHNVIPISSPPEIIMPIRTKR